MQDGPGIGKLRLFGHLLADRGGAQQGAKGRRWHSRAGRIGGFFWVSNVLFGAWWMHGILLWLVPACVIGDVRCFVERGSACRPTTSYHGAHAPAVDPLPLSTAATHWTDVTSCHHVRQSDKRTRADTETNQSDSDSFLVRRADSFHRVSCTWLFFGRCARCLLIN